MADIKSTLKGLEKIADVFWRRYETSHGEKAVEYYEAYETVTDAINLLKEVDQED